MDDFLLPVIVGPTAVGKTAVAVNMAEYIGAEIISTDSRQIYQGMAIGTGAPSAEELRRVPHHLIGVISPIKRLSAGDYARLAREAIIDIRNRGLIPLVVGGSGLYIKALTEGLAPIPPSDSLLRCEIEAEVDQLGMTAMIQRLAKIDPDYASKVSERDRKRLVRALEVWKLTGKSFSAWHQEKRQDGFSKVVFWGLTRPRAELWDMIERRINNMISSGWLDEVKALAEAFGGLNHLPPPVTEGLGYRSIAAVLLGQLDPKTAVSRIVIATRQFAKRQMTWFKADNRVKWNEQSGSDAVECWTKWCLQDYQTALGAKTHGF
ncbi:MAG: tRNA (adenosine(37)-N6)-dimethylallyltransferase MiaA [Calditrichota bacterium]